MSDGSLKSTSPQVLSAPIKLLLIQDSKEDSNLVKLSLQAVGQTNFEIVEATTLSAGLQSLKASCFDAVLLDLNLPDSAGLATLIKLRNASISIPIIVLTELGEQEIALEALQNGAQDYLVKGAPGSESIQRQIRFAIERKRADETILRLNLLEQREHFIGMLAHDLRNPIIGGQRILGLILAGAVGDVPDGVARLLTLLANSKREQLLLINNVLDSYRLEQGAECFKLLDTNLSTLVAECVREFLPIAYSKNIEILNSCTDNIPVNADRLATRRVVTNLLSNAIKFTPTKGKIQIRLECDGNIASLFVTDNGIGMDPEQLSRVFQRFYQAKSNYRADGLGLGLHLCKELIEAQNGTITCISAPQCGTTFEIRLMLGAKVSRRPVLIVDHSMSNIETLQKLLENHSINSTFVHCGVEAVKAIANTDFALVFIDIKMPEMEGLSAAKALLSAGTDMPVIACTPRLTTEQREMLIAAGINDILEKPVDDDCLKQLLDRLLPGLLTAAAKV
jgi:signal transduction histidine kinase